MFAGSVMSKASTLASAILVRVLASLSEYSSSGNAAIRHLLVPHELGGFAPSSRGPLYSLPVQDQVLEHALRGARPDACIAFVIDRTRSWSCGISNGM